MSIAQTQLDIINQSIDVLGATPLTSIDDNSVEADKLIRAFDFVLRRILADYPFNFAYKKVKVDGVKSDNADDERYYYQVPADALKIWQVNNNVAFERYIVSIGGSDTDIVIPQCHKSYNYYNDSSIDPPQACIDYIFLNTDVTMWTALFTDYFIYSLAEHLARTTRESSSSVQIINQQRQEFEFKAKNADAKESGSYEFIVAGRRWWFLNDFEG